MIFNLNGEIYYKENKYKMSFLWFVNIVIALHNHYFFTATLSYTNHVLLKKIKSLGSKYIYWFSRNQISTFICCHLFILKEIHSNKIY